MTMERRRILASVGAALGVVLVLVVGVVLFVTQTDWGRERVRTFALQVLNAAAEGEVTLGRIEGNLLRGIQLLDVSIVDLQGRPFVRADTLSTRFSLLSLVRQRIILSDVRMVNGVIVLDQPPGEEWNWVRIFPSDPDAVEEPGQAGWGGYTELRDVSLVDTRIEVRTEWQAPDDLTPQEQEEALRQALSDDGRENLEEVPGGYQSVMSFRELNGEFPLIRPSNPDSSAIPIRIASLSGIIAPFKPPEATVEDLSGDFRLIGDSLYFTDVNAVLPGSRVAAEGVYALESGDLELGMEAARAALADFRFLYPPLPEEGGGTIRMTMNMRDLATHIIAEELDLRIGGSTLAGQVDLTVGDTLRIQNTNLRFADFDTRLIERLAPEVEIPVHGSLTGQLGLAGTIDRMRVDADIGFEEETGGSSRVLALGDVGFGETVRLGELQLQLDPLRADLIRTFAPDLPLRGTISGFANLSGEIGGPLEVESDLVLRDPWSGVSRVSATGGVDLGEEIRLRNLVVDLDPLRLDLVREDLPDVPAGGTLAGRLRLDGFVTRRLQVDGNLALNDPQSGVSRIAATGGIAFADGVAFDQLRLRAEPVQLDLARPWAADLPPGATVTGVATLDGVPASGVRINADLSIADPGLPIGDDPTTSRDATTSRLTAVGGIIAGDELVIDGMQLRFTPVQTDLARGFAPDMPAGGVLTGDLLLDGAPAGQLGFVADVTHTEGTELSRIVGAGTFDSRPGGFVSANVDLQPLSLDVAGRFVPPAELRGDVSGTVDVSGPLADLLVSAGLRFEDGGEVETTARLDLESEVVAYDSETRITNLDLFAISGAAPAATDLTGTIDADGRGIELATMFANVNADLVGSGVAGTGADEVRMRLAIANGLATFEETSIRLGTAEASLEGNFGLVAGQSGELRFLVDVDSLHTFAALSPGLAPDSTSTATGAPIADGAPPVAVPGATPGEADPPVRTAGTERIGGVTRVRYPGSDREVEPPPAPEDADIDPAVADTVPQAPPSPDPTPQVALVAPDSIAGSVQAEGTIRGNIEIFDIEAEALIEELVFQGNQVGRLEGRLAATDARAPAMDLEADVDLRRVQAFGVALDSAIIDGVYAGDREGAGRVFLAAFQNDSMSIRANGEFSLSLAGGELRLAEATVHSDDVTWQTTQPGVVRWSEEAIEAEQLELTSTAGGRIYADGQFVAEGTSDFELEVEDLEIGDFLAFLQRENTTTGTLSLTADVAGTQRAPSIQGEAALVGAIHRDILLPDLRTTFSYADLALTAHAEVAEEGRIAAVADASLPIDLALTLDAETRLLQGPVTADLRADSLSLDILTAFTDQLEVQAGVLDGEVTVRGSYETPEFGGVANLTADYVNVAPLGIWFERVAGATRLEDERVVVDSLVAWSGGPIRLTGEIALPTPAEPEFDLAIVATDARVIDTEDARLNLDADLQVTGPMDAVRITGDVHTRRGVIYIPLLADLGAGEVVNLDDPGTFARIDTLFVVRRDRLLARSPILENFGLELAIHVDRDVWLRSIEANVEIYTPPEIGPLRVRMNGGLAEMVLDGAINTDRGEYEFMSRRFVLTRGAITFVEELGFNPFIQIAAEHEVRLPGRESFSIRVVLDGQMENLAIALESNAQPPISQTDLLSFLAFGSDASSLLQQQGSALSSSGSGGGDLAGNVAAMATQQLAAVAIDAVATELESDAARGLGLDVVRITPADLPAEVFTGSYLDVLRGTEVEAGRYITPRLFLGGQARPTLVFPGALIEYRTPIGLRWVTTWQPRYLPVEPTLGHREVERASVFGTFLSREWRF